MVITYRRESNRNTNNFKKLLLFNVQYLRIISQNPFKITSMKKNINTGNVFVFEIILMLSLRSEKRSLFELFNYHI